MLLKNVFTLALSFMFTVQVYSQKLSFGVHGGANFSTFHLAAADQPRFEASLQPGYIFGANISIELDDWIALRTEINFDKRNSKGEIMTDQSNGVPEYSSLEQGDYLSLPVMLQFEMGGHTEFITQIGTTINYLRGQAVTMKTLVIDGEHVDTYQDPEQILKTDLSLLAGIGLRIPIGDKIDLFCLTRAFYDFMDNEAGHEVNKVNYSGMVGIQYLLGKDWEEKKK